MPVIDGKIFKTLYVDRGPTKYKTLTVDKGPTKYKTLFVDRSQTQYKPLTWNKGPTKYKTLYVDRGPTKYKSLKYQLEQEDTPYQVFTDKMIERNKVIEPLSPGHPEATSSINYFPTHFLPSEPRRPFFRGEDAKFNSIDMRKQIRSNLEVAASKTERFPDQFIRKDSKPRYIISDLSQDAFRYYITINDSSIVEYELSCIFNDKKYFKHLFSNVSKDVNYSYSPSSTVPLGAAGFKFPLNIPDPEYGADWYAGFIDDTSISYWPRHSGFGHITFSDDVIRISIPVCFRKGERNTLNVATRIGSSIWQRDIVFIDPFVKNYLNRFFVNYDLFNHISFESDTYKELDRVTIKLNEQIVCDTDMVLNAGLLDRFGGNISPGNPLQIDEFINATKFYRAGKPSSEIIQLAAKEIGRAWCHKYRSKWGNNWCSEFATWLIWKSKGFATGRESHELRLGDWNKQLNSQHLVNFFINNAYVCFINPEQNIPSLGQQYEWENLSWAAEEGCYTSIQNGGHSCFFINWGNSTLNKTDFDRYKSINNYASIGGNQGGTVNIGNVRINENSWEDSSAWRPDYLAWSGVRTNLYTEGINPYWALKDGDIIRDGFGNIERGEGILRPLY